MGNAARGGRVGVEDRPRSKTPVATSNTLVIFTSDNGFSNCEHRWGASRFPTRSRSGYRSSSRCPGRSRGYRVRRARIQCRPGTDDRGLRGGVARGGRRVAAPPAHRCGVIRPDSVVLEHAELDPPVPTYCGVRTQQFTFVHYATGEEELYDLVKDPRQLRNVASRETRTGSANSVP